MGPIGTALSGSAGNDVLYGGAGKDALKGAAGADVMIGGQGDDTYYVDNPGDVVTEAARQGSDTVWATVNYILSPGSEIEFLRPSA
ncbi:hypothetical protein ABTO49_20995, partial [Acinetobacter baumannii]